MRKRLLALLGILAIMFTAITPSFAAEGRVLMKAPAKDAAFVASFPGFKNMSVDTFVRKIGLQEGLVIRQSRIENGKIIIPPSGLYYTTRTNLAKVLQGDKVLILGKIYTLVDNGTRFDVIKDVEVKKGGSVPLGDGTKVLELSSISLDGDGFEAPKAEFQILKPSGNYYGHSFPVATDAKLINITTGTLNNGTSKHAGSYLPGEEGQNWQVEYYDSPVATSGQSYLVVDEVTTGGAKVKEFGTGAINWMLLTEKDPVEMVLGPGETATLGDYTVKVTEVTANSATVELIAKDGTVTKKVLGPVTPEVLKYLPADEVNRNKMVVRPAKEDVQVQLDLYRTPFRDGKVALVGYTDLFKLNNPDKWPSDPRFIARPDT
ncbi:hypothetical protein MGLY_34400 [Neomoorella glycerini]|uniref:Copper amine oxidase-like N-terminal domain-containing protein n=1 Tax=Neomoorella glycerini TaxID=55779 RepID=A0A6I5ZWJ8_9FIRM|nr:hypothetical protein [Moorella glycerini]QGP94015.1 hypothetical protein MGLY_34400 [Moorella glycerini]